MGTSNLTAATSRSIRWKRGKLRGRSGEPTQHLKGGFEAKVATVSLSCEILEDAEALLLPTRESQLSAALFSRAI